MLGGTAPAVGETVAVGDTAGEAMGDALGEAAGLAVAAAVGLVAAVAAGLGDGFDVAVQPQSAAAMSVAVRKIANIRFMLNLL